jgi:hypothetical protein
MEWNGAQELNDQLNVRLIEFLKMQIGKQKINKASLCDEMGMSTSVLYKRLSGHSQFTLGELAYIMKRFNLSFDSWIWPGKDRVVVNLPGIQTPVASIEDFLRRLDHLFSRLYAGTNPRIQYATREMPIFYYFINPKLGAFKLYFFGRFIWKAPGMIENIRFTMDLISKHILSEIKNLWTKYASIPSVEIWNPNVWDNTLQQVLYLLELRDFENPTDALEIIKAIKQVIEQTEKITKRGYKTFEFDNKSGKIVYYNNRITHTNNIILARNATEEMVFITHDNPNYMISTNADLIQYTDRWMELLKEHAEMLQEENMEDFFRLQYQKVDLAMLKAEGLISRDSQWI